MSKDLYSPTRWSPDESGGMQSIEPNLGGYVAEEDYGELLIAYEELRSPALDSDAAYGHSVRRWSGCQEVLHTVTHKGSVLLHTYMMSLGGEHETHVDAFLQLAVDRANEKEAT